MHNYKMNIYKISFILFLILFTVENIFSQNVVYPRDVYRVRSGKLTERGAIDFTFYSAFQKLTERRITRNVLGDTLIDLVGSNLTDIFWNFKYGYDDNLEFNISGATFFDKQGSKFRYGAGDLKLGLKFGFQKSTSTFNASTELYYLLPTGFNEGGRLVRAFSRGNGGFGIDNAVEFNFSSSRILVNLGYFHNKDLYEKIPTKKFLVWYPILSGYQGLTSDGEIINSRQLSFGIGSEINFLMGRKLFLEYRSGTIFAREGDTQTIGKFAAGLSLTKGDNFIVKLGYEKSTLSSLEPNSAFFLNVRLNSVFKTRRVRGAVVPTITERPTMEAGGKPFFVREGVVFSKIRDPITDHIIVIDGSPSMIGRGIDAGNRGENVLRDIVDFTQTVVDSIADNSNVALITFADNVNVITWRNINDAKREDIKNSIKDIPDEVLNIAAQFENNPPAQGQKLELLINSILKAYEELASFTRGDYNRIHLQRVILFTDGIYDGAMQEGEYGPQLDAIMRRYNIKRDDFRYFYYIFANVRGAEKVDYDLVSFVEEENGKAFRKIDVNNQEHIGVGDLNFENIKNQQIFRYYSQITKLAIMPFNTLGRGAISSAMTTGFKEVFDYNRYFQLTPMSDVLRVLENYGFSVGEKLKLPDIQKIGKNLGVDYVVYGELLEFQDIKTSSFYIPMLIGFPVTKMKMTVAINLVDVSDGSLAYVSNVSADKSRGRGITLFPSSKEVKNRTLNVIDKEKLQKELIAKWIDNVLKSMFEDVSVIKP